MATFQNWSGDVQATPRQIAYPATENEIVNLVKQAEAEGLRIRLVGHGHSFMPLVHTGDILISLDKYQGIVAADVAHCQVVVKAGTQIGKMGKMLYDYGMGLANQGDIDVQSIAGAISTGTHGSGVNFGSLATMVVGMRLITATGEIIECSETENREIFKAAQLSMGMIGIISTLRLQLVPAYKLHYVTDKMRLSEGLSRLEEAKKNRNFEFYYFPHTEIIQRKIMNATEEPADSYGIANYLSDVVLENWIFQAFSTLSKYIPPLTIPIAKLIGPAASSASRKCWSHEVYPTPRWVRFREMEYNIPAQYFEEAIVAIKKWIDEKQFRVHFPIECRFVKSDDIWLSPAFGRESAYIAVHQYKGMDSKAYFDAVEAICQSYGGRPHWGKINTCDATYLAKNYPHWQDFLRIRRKLDPKGMFLNDYLKSVFE